MDLLANTAILVDVPVKLFSITLIVSGVVLIGLAAYDLIQACSQYSSRFRPHGRRKPSLPRLTDSFNSYPDPSAPRPSADGGAEKSPNRYANARVTKSNRSL